jgi:prolyl-tRNA synthetase
MRTRLFLRTTEFLWQEGHTVHATQKEAEAETKKMLDVYATFAQEYLAIPVIKGEKTESERFPGALQTFSIEAMMQDRKALQAGTSHFLGQNFSKASEIKFQSKEGVEEYAWTTSWGVSTRLIGALIMAHSDDDGLVLPPKIAPAHIAIIPIYKNDEQRQLVMDFVEKLQQAIKPLRFDEKKIRTVVDDREMRGGEKVWGWIKKGIPIRLEIGPRDIQNNSLFMGRRDKAPKDKGGILFADFIETVPEILQEIQDNIYTKAEKFRQENTLKIDDKDKFYKFFTAKDSNNPELHGGFAHSHWCGSAACEEQIKDDLKVTIRNIPENSPEEAGECINCGKASQRRVIFSKSY